MGGKKKHLSYDFFLKLISTEIISKSELIFQCIIARQERETDSLKPTNKLTDGNADAQTVQHFTEVNPTALSRLCHAI